MLLANQQIGATQESRLERFHVQPMIAATAAAAMRAALQEAMEQIAANAPGAAAGTDPETLHQVRVGTRRLRAALRASRGLWREDDVRALRRQLRELAAVSGPARDWDVFLRTASAPLRARARHRQRKALQRAARTDWADPAGRHALRIRLRRLRYVSEFMSGAFPERSAGVLLRSLKDLQDLLGALNDIEVARRLTRKLAGRKARSEERERKLLSQLPGAWRRFAAAPRFWRGLR